MNKLIRLILVLPVVITYKFMGETLKKIIDEDMNVYLQRQYGGSLPSPKLLLSRREMFLIRLFLRHIEFRNIFYFRMPDSTPKNLLSFFAPPFKSLYMTPQSKMSVAPGGFFFHHPFSTIVNAKEIGKGCLIRNNTTIGNTHENLDNSPIIGDNVNIGANAVIIGKIRIGSNVIIGAGSVVVKDVPNNCIVAGNPAHVIRYIEP